MQLQCCAGAVPSRERWIERQKKESMVARLHELDEQLRPTREFRHDRVLDFVGVDRRCWFKAHWKVQPAVLDVPEGDRDRAQGLGPLAEFSLNVAQPWQIAEANVVRQADLDGRFGVRADAASREVVSDGVDFGVLQGLRRRGRLAAFTVLAQEVFVALIRTVGGGLVSGERPAAVVTRDRDCLGGGRVPVPEHVATHRRSPPRTAV